MTGFPEFPANGHAFSADETGQALAGLVRRDANGMPVPGMLGGVKATAVAAAWKVQVSPFAYVRRIAAAVGISGLSAAEQVDITPATGIPVGQARIDRVCWNPVTSVLQVLEGVPSTSPAAPAAGSLASICRVRVNAGDGMVVAGQVTPDFAATGLANSSDGEQRTVALTLSGASSWSGYFSFQNFATVTFPTPFDAAPNLEVTGVFPSGAVQLMQVTQVTATGFSGRVIRFGHATPLAGTVTYTASEK